MKTEFDHFNFRLKFSWNLWNIVSRRIKKLCDFWTCPRKIEIKVQPIDVLSWIKFRDPELNQQSSLQNFSFPSLPSRSEPRDHKVSLKPHSEATRKDPDQKKIPRASFDVLDLCAKFQSHISTESTLNRGTTTPLRDQICACLVKSQIWAEPKYGQLQFKPIYQNSIPKITWRLAACIIKLHFDTYLKC